MSSKKSQKETGDCVSDERIVFSNTIIIINVAVVTVFLTLKWKFLIEVATNRYSKAKV